MAIALNPLHTETHPEWHYSCTRETRCRLKRATLASTARHLREVAATLDGFAALSDRSLDTPVDETTEMILQGPAIYLDRTVEMLCWLGTDTLPSHNTVREAVWILTAADPFLSSLPWAADHELIGRRGLLTREQLQAMSDDEWLAIDGVGPATLRKLRAFDEDGGDI